jgi:hypothetical protein
VEDGNVKAPKEVIDVVSSAVDKLAVSPVFPAVATKPKEQVPLTLTFEHESQDEAKHNTRHNI